MNFKVLVHIILISVFALLVDSLPVAAHSNMAKPNCPEKCGGVNIPYPFGIGEGCYHSEWFSITCKSKPFLTKVDIEVEVIQIQGKLVVLNFPLTVANSNCANGSSSKVWTSPDFEKSPFVFSRDLNEFKVVGCDYALLQTHRKGVDTTLADCMNPCTNTDTNRKQGCFEFNRCQTTIPVDDLSSYRIVINRKATSNCTYAFLLGDYGLFHDSFVDMLTNSPLINETDHFIVPVIMKWRLDHLGDLKLGNFTTYLCLEEQSSMNTEQSSYSCKCGKNYYGNPYIVNGCTVVEICAKCEKECFQTPEGGHYCHPSHKSEIIFGSSLGGGLLLFVLFGFVSWLYKIIKKRRIVLRKRKFFMKNGGLLLQQQISSDETTIEKTIVFTAKDLENATDKFNENRILGQGGQGTVYKGMLTDGKLVAIKKSKVVDESQLQQFINEVVILSQINHRNIVKLLGCCLETQVPLLVYEFISNGNLFELIHDQNEEFPLSWKMRLQIATDVAGALAYLHSASSTPIYHRDIKSTNILLDEKYRAKVADFGTSRTITIDQTHLTTLVCGTFGYLDPEYFQSSQFTDKSDVYSFGVVLVELLTGKKPISSKNSNEDRSLASRFMMHLEESRLFRILDARVTGEATKGELNAVADIARRCLNLTGKRRPTMKQVMMELEGVRLSEMPLASALKNIHADESRIETKDVITSQSNRSYQRVFSDVDSLLINTI